MAKKLLSSKANYVSKRMINELEVERKGKTTYIDGADLIDGMYVKKGVKYAKGSTVKGGGVDLDKDKFSLASTNDDLVEMVIGENWTAKQFKEHFLNKGYELKSDTSIVGFYFSKPNGQTFQLVPSFHKRGEILKYAKGSTVKGADTISLYETFLDDKNREVSRILVQYVYSEERLKKMLQRAEKGTFEMFDKGRYDYKQEVFVHPRGVKEPYLDKYKKTDWTIEGKYAKGSTVKGGGVKYAVVDENSDRIYVRSTDKDFIDKKHKELKEIYPNDKLSVVKLAKGSTVKGGDYKFGYDITLKKHTSKNGTDIELRQNPKTKYYTIFVNGFGGTSTPTEFLHVAEDDYKYELSKYESLEKRGVFAKGTTIQGVLDKYYLVKHNKNSYELKDKETDRLVWIGDYWKIHNALQDKAKLTFSEADTFMGNATKYAKGSTVKGEENFYNINGIIKTKSGIVLNVGDDVLLHNMYEVKVKSINTDTNSVIVKYPDGKELLWGTTNIYVKKYAKGGGVGEKKYVFSDYFVTVFEDSYEDGEGTKAFNDYQEKVGKTYNSIESLIKDMNKIMGTEYSREDFDWETGEGQNVQTSVMVDEDLIPPHANEVERWKKGEIKLYNAHYWFNVLPVHVADKYAKGGAMTSGWCYSIGGL